MAVTRKTLNKSGVNPGHGASATVGSFTDSCSVEVDGVEIAGTVWATRNVNAPGTFAANPQDFGMFFQWNRRVGWSNSGTFINSDGGTTWDTTTPIGTTWYLANDPCPTGWRVPTHMELQGLAASNPVQGSIGSVSGRYFGTIPNRIFLPSTGYRNTNGNLSHQGNQGHYRSSTPVSGNQSYSMYFNPGGGSLKVYHYNNRVYGFSVRCVAK